MSTPANNNGSVDCLKQIESAGSEIPGDKYKPTYQFSIQIGSARPNLFSKEPHGGTTMLAMQTPMLRKLRGHKATSSLLLPSVLSERPQFSLVLLDSSSVV